MTSGGVAIPISSAVYNASALTVTLFPSQRLNLQKTFQLTVIGMPPSGLTSVTGVALAGGSAGAAGTDFVTSFSGDILAGPAPELLRNDPKKFRVEEKQFVAFERRLAAETRKAAAKHNHLAAAQKKLAAQHNQSAAQLARSNGMSVSAVDQLLGSEMMSVSGIVKELRSGVKQPNR